jgi:hypothetical protein
LKAHPIFSLVMAVDPCLLIFFSDENLSSCLRPFVVIHTKCRFHSCCSSA